MRRISKLLVALALFAASIAAGPSVKPAEAAWCSDYCVDPGCTCIIHCWRMGGSCICEDFCSFE